MVLQTLAALALLYGLMFGVGSILLLKGTTAMAMAVLAVLGGWGLRRLRRA
jgi:hypothetical protein